MGIPFSCVDPPRERARARAALLHALAESLSLGTPYLPRHAPTRCAVPGSVSVCESDLSALAVAACNAMVGRPIAIDPLVATVREVDDAELVPPIGASGFVAVARETRRVRGELRVLIEGDGDRCLRARIEHDPQRRAEVPPQIRWALTGQDDSTDLQSFYEAIPAIEAALTGSGPRRLRLRYAYDAIEEVD